jgi:tRNA A37 threonylcarbamoyladenosine dehydratase
MDPLEHKVVKINTTISCNLKQTVIENRKLFYDKYETALNTISKENLTAEEKTATKSSNGKLRLEKSTQTAYQFTSCTSILGHTPTMGQFAGGTSTTF